MIIGIACSRFVYIFFLFIFNVIICRVVQNSLWYVFFYCFSLQLADFDAPSKNDCFDYTLFKVETVKTSSFICFKWASTDCRVFNFSSIMGSASHHTITKNDASCQWMFGWATHNLELCINFIYRYCFKYSMHYI